MRTLIFEADTCHDEPVPDFPALLASPSAVLWVDIPAHTAIERDLLRNVFCVHPLALDHISLRNQRPVVEDYQAHLFAIVVSASYRQATLETHDINIFVGPNYLVTVHHRRDLFVERAMDRVAQRVSRLPISPTYFLYTLVDTIVDGYIPILMRIGDEIDRLETNILENPRDKQLSELVELKRSLRSLARILWPQHDFLQTTLSGKHPHLRDTRLDFYFRDVNDHMLRVTDLLAVHRDSLIGVIDLYMSSSSNRLSMVINRLTVLTLIIGGLSVVGGFYGMNFAHMWPDLVIPGSISFALLGMSLVIVVGILYWRRMK